MRPPVTVSGQRVIVSGQRVIVSGQSVIVSRPPVIVSRQNVILSLSKDGAEITLSGAPILRQAQDDTLACEHLRNIVELGDQRARAMLARRRCSGRGEDARVAAN